MKYLKVIVGLGLIPICGKLSDLFGRKPIILFGIKELPHPCSIFCNCSGKPV